jgi:hypothetical protein
MMDKQKQQVAVRQCDMEVMKMAMLKHEETFRQQVHACLILSYDF